MNRLSGSALLLAALFSTGVQADDDGLSLQQQRDKIGEDMVRERTGTPPANQNDANQTMDSRQQPGQQSPRSTLNSPARQDGNSQQPSSQNLQRQPSSTTPGIGSQGSSTSQAGSSGGSSAPPTPGTDGGSQGTGGAVMSD